MKHGLVALDERSRKPYLIIGVAVASIVLLIAAACGCGRRASTPTAPSTPGGTQVVPGVSLSVPQAWMAQPSSDQSGALISNVRELSPMEADAANEAAFRIKVMANANPANLPIGQWFDDYYANGFDGPVQSRSNIVVDGRPALSVEVLASGQWRLVFIARASDVIRLSYEMSRKNFANEYEALLGSVKIAP